MSSHWCKAVIEQVQAPPILSISTSDLTAKSAASGSSYSFVPPPAPPVVNTSYANVLKASSTTQSSSQAKNSSNSIPYFQNYQKLYSNPLEAPAGNESKTVERYEDNFLNNFTIRNTL